MSDFGKFINKPQATIGSVNSSQQIRSVSKTREFIKDIIGLPPSIYTELEANPNLVEKFTLATMPLLALYPAYPMMGSGSGLLDESQSQNTTKGLQLYDIDEEEGKKNYNSILTSCGINGLSGKCLYVSFLNDTSISESFGVEYGESKFEGVANFASSSLTELRYITGSKDAAESIKKAGDFASKQGTAMGGIAGMVASGLSGVAGILQGAIGAVGGTGFKNILTGSKVDFPMIWTGSSYAPSYSFTVRLYNPDQNDVLHKEAERHNFA